MISKKHLTGYMRHTLPLYVTLAAALLTSSTVRAHESHPGDVAKHDEHEAIMDLVPITAATHVATNSGSWSSAST